MGISPDNTAYYSGQYKPGISHVGSYQVSGRPWITGSTILADGEEDVIRFPSVTKSITIITRAEPDIRVHFAPIAGGYVISNRHYITLTSDKDSMTMNVKTSELYISRDDGAAGNASYQVFAELTGIPAGSMWELTGSGITE